MSTCLMVDVEDDMCRQEIIRNGTTIQVRTRGIVMTMQDGDTTLQYAFTRADFATFLAECRSMNCDG